MQSVEYYPEYGTERIKRWFAWIPVTVCHYYHGQLKKRETRRWQFVTVRQIYREAKTNLGYDCWVNVEFIDE